MVNSATFLVSVGGDGTTVTDDANTNTGLANGGHRDRLVPAFSNIVSIADYVVEKALEAQAAAAAAAGGATTNGTSSTTANVPALNANLTLNNMLSSLTYQPGMKVAAVSTSAPTTRAVYGTVVSWTPGAGPSTGTLVVAATEEVVGAGNSVSGWSVSLSQFGVPKARQINTSGLATGGGDLSANRTIDVPAASASDLWALAPSAIKALTPAAERGAVGWQALSYSSTITVNGANGVNFKTTLTGSPTLAMFTNTYENAEGDIEFTQDGTGGRALTLPSGWKPHRGVPSQLSTAAGAKDLFHYKVLEVDGSGNATRMAYSIYQGVG